MKRGVYPRIYRNVGSTLIRTGQPCPQSIISTNTGRIAILPRGQISANEMKGGGDIADATNSLLAFFHLELEQLKNESSTNGYLRSVKIEIFFLSLSLLRKYHFPPFFDRWKKYNASVYELVNKVEFINNKGGGGEETLPRQWRVKLPVHIYVLGR